MVENNGALDRRLISAVGTHVLKVMGSTGARATHSPRSTSCERVGALFLIPKLAATRYRFLKKCAKAGRPRNSSCKCARFSMCTNMEEMLAIDDAVMEANVALTRSEVGSEEFSD